MAENEKNVDVEASGEKPAAKKSSQKKNKYQEEIAALKEEIAKQKDLLLRTAAEFDNYKRRTTEQSVSAAEYVKAGMLKKLLPVFDNVDRAALADKESADYAKGVELTVKMLTEAVTELGMVEIGKVGEAFDPKFHEAVMHIDDESLGENVISQVLQKGYKIGDMVIRPAMVAVAN